MIHFRVVDFDAVLKNNENSGLCDRKTYDSLDEIVAALKVDLLAENNEQTKGYPLAFQRANYCTETRYSDLEL